MDSRLRTSWQVTNTGTKTFAMTVPYTFYASVGPDNHLTAAYWNSTSAQLVAGCTYLGDRIYQPDSYLTETYGPADQPSS